MVGGLQPTRTGAEWLYLRGFSRHSVGIVSRNRGYLVPIVCTYGGFMSQIAKIAIASVLIVIFGAVYFALRPSGLSPVVMAPSPGPKVGGVNNPSIGGVNNPTQDAQGNCLIPGYVYVPERKACMPRETRTPIPGGGYKITVEHPPGVPGQYRCDKNTREPANPGNAWCTK